MTNTNQSPAAGDVEVEMMRSDGKRDLFGSRLCVHNLGMDSGCNPCGRAIGDFDKNGQLTSTKAEPSQIAEVRERHKKTTPGEWTSDSVKSEGTYGIGDDDHEGFDAFQISVEIAGKTETLADSLNASYSMVDEDSDEDGHWAWDEIARNNFNFIAHAHQDIPDLLSHITAIEAERCLSCGVKPGKIDCDPGTSNVELRQEIESLQSERDRMREALENIADVKQGRMEPPSELIRRIKAYACAAQKAAHAKMLRDEAEKADDLETSARALNRLADKIEGGE